MPDTASSTLGSSMLVEASMLLARCRSHAEIVAWMERTLEQTAGLTRFDLVWSPGSAERSLRAVPSALPAPSAAARLRMADGDVAVEGSTTYVPMVARGLLQGWIATDASFPIEPWLRAWAANCAAALISVGVVAVRAPDRARAAIDAIAQVVSSTLDLNLLLARIATVVRELIDVSGFTVVLIDPETEQLGFALVNVPEGTMRPEMRWALDEGLTGVVIRTGEPLCTDDYLRECGRRGISPVIPPGVEYATAWLGVPLRHQDHILGVMIVTHDAPGARFEATEVQLLSTVASQIAAAVANAQLYARVEQQASQLALINKIGRTVASTLDPQAVPMLLVRELADALEIDDALVHIYDPADGLLEVRYAQPEAGRTGTKAQAAGAAQEALRRSEVVIAEGVAADGAARCSVLCAPLNGRQLKGLIELRAPRARGFRRADIALVEAVAEQATIALENAVLHGQTDEALRMHVHNLEERNRQLAEVVRIGSTFRTTFDVQQLGELIIHAVHTLVDAPRVLLGLVDAEQQYLHIRAGIGIQLEQAGQPRECWITLHDLSAWLARGQPVGTFSYQLGRHPSLPEFEDIRVIPIHDSRGALIGTIFLEAGGSTQSLTPDLTRTLEIVANQAGIALTNAMLYIEQQQTVDRLTALNALSLTISTGQLAEEEIINMAVAGAVGTTSGTTGGAIIAVDGRAPAQYGPYPGAVVDGEWLQGVLPADGDYSELTEDDVPIALRDEGIQRLLVAPLRGPNLTVGTLWIGYVQPISTKAERETAVLYAKMTGAVLENLYLAGAVRNAHDRMASILLSTREGMLLVGKDSRISITNRAFGQLLGIDESRLLNHSVANACRGDTLGELPEGECSLIRTVLQKVVDGSSEVAEGQVTVPGANERFLTWHVLPVHAAARENAGALLVVRDVTADRQMERLRQDLANMIVHDLRSPLTNILVSVDLLLKPATGPLNERQRRILDITSSSSHQMLDLVNALLDIRRLEKNTVELQRRPIDLPGVAEAVTDLLERIADERAVRVTVELDALPLVEADAEMIRRVLQNLVDNALKFSPPDTTVYISGAVASPEMLPAGHPEGSWVVVEVRDQGTGIPEEYQQVIFQLFVQAPEGHGHGTGIGLSFCRLAVEAHGGRIWVESAPGQGSTFRFTLPAVAPHEPARAWTPRAAAGS